MEPITATLTTAKEIYEAAKTIQKVYNVSKEMKTVAESEGKDQIMATKDLAETAATMKKESAAEKSPNSNKELSLEGDLHYGEIERSNIPHGDFVDVLEPVSDKIGPISEQTEFVDMINSKGFPEDSQILQNIYIDSLHSPALQNEAVKDVTEQQSSSSIDATDKPQEKKLEGLTDEEKQEIKEKTGWSDKIVDAIRSKEEAQIYIDAGLVEGEVNGKLALLQPSIDGKECNDPKWPDWNNKELAEEGYPPRDKNGRPYELHHIGQNPDSPLAELTYEQHHSDGNFKVLHTFDESSIDRTQFNKERKEYWSERSKSL